MLKITTFPSWSVPKLSFESQASSFFQMYVEKADMAPLSQPPALHPKHNLLGFATFGQNHSFWKRLGGVTWLQPSFNPGICFIALYIVELREIIF